MPIWDYRKWGDARRLAVLLDQYADDPTTVKKLAQVLHYDVMRLEVDMI